MPRLAVLLSLLSLSAVSCDAQSRLWRISPIDRDADPTDPERVTLWPILYADSTSAAVLWPLMDFDDHGFAVRPLVAKDDEQLDVLFPLSHFDLDRGNWWALNAYSFHDNTGLFPLWNFGPEFGFAWPAFWFREQGEVTFWGLFPLGARNERTGDGYFLTAYQFGDATGVLPLFHVSSGFNYVGPVWWDSGDAAADDDGGLFPLYWHNASEQGATTTFVPFYWYREHGERRELVTPLGGRGWDASGATNFVNVLGPVFHHQSYGDHELTALLWPLYIRDASANEGDTWLAAGLAHVGTTSAGSSWRFWPFASSSDDALADGWIDQATLFRHEERGDVTRNRLFPIYDGERGPDVEEDELLFSLARRIETSAGSSWRLWPLASKTDSAVEGAPGLHDLVDDLTLVGVDRSPERFHVHAGTPLLFSLDRQGEQLQSWDVHVLGLSRVGHHERPPKSGEPTCVERDGAGFLFDWFKVERSVVQETDGATHVDRHLRLPLLHEYESTPARTEWDLLCYAVHSEKCAAEEKFSVLGYAWRSTTTATETHRDIFPAITYDQTPDSTRWSFFWRLLRYRREGDRTGGHVLFIPWGDA